MNDYQGDESNKEEEIATACVANVLLMITTVTRATKRRRRHLVLDDTSAYIGCATPSTYIYHLYSSIYLKYICIFIYI